MCGGLTPPPKIWVLPPLILHPFSDETGPSRLLESSRASLVLHGILPDGGATEEQLEEKLLAGRYCEMRMLFYIGKDLFRWIEQCLDFFEHRPELARQGFRLQSLASYLVYSPPQAVRDKLRRWGVAEYRGIFSRALGIKSVFEELPARETLARDFLRYYYKYADHFFAALLALARYPEIDPAQFDFALYASGEYARLLEQSWGNT
mgnify:CR=1 FL=1